MTVTASDPDAGTTFTYSINGGADSAKFAINSSTGALTFVSAPNFEAPTDVGADNVYNVTVQVSDGSLTATKAVAVTVTNVNDAPVFSSASNLTTITEDQTSNAGQLVSSLFTSTDEDAGAVNGIALYSQTPSNGTWQYSTDGGTTWNGVGAVSGSSALLLRST